MNFHQKVYALVKKIPKGKVTSYGFIATLLGKPRAARQVGWALFNMIEDLKIPWWRVINSKGYISIKNPRLAIARTARQASASKELQKHLLEKEGVKVTDKYMIDLNKYLWRPQGLSV